MGNNLIARKIKMMALTLISTLFVHEAEAKLSCSSLTGDSAFTLDQDVLGSASETHGELKSGDLLNKFVVIPTSSDESLLLSRYSYQLIDSERQAVGTFVVVVKVKTGRGGCGRAGCDAFGAKTIGAQLVYEDKEIDFACNQTGQ